MPHLHGKVTWDLIYGMGYGTTRAGCWRFKIAMNKYPLPISVVIVNYNAGKFLLDCVYAALAQATEVIVVDNHSHDNSMLALQTAFPNESRLILHFVGKNLGFSAGCNIGFHLVSQSCVLFLNPDGVLQTGSLARMFQVLERDPTIGMVGGFLVNPDGTEQRGGRRLIPTPWRAFVRAFGLTSLSIWWPKLFKDFNLNKQTLPTQPVEAEAISGACMLVRNEAVKDVGLWDEGYFLHCEDLDWCMRFRLNHWKIIFVPDAMVMHQKGACSHARPIRVEWHKHNGMIYFYRKFFKDRYPAVLIWLVILAIWMRFAMVTIYYSAFYQKVKS